MDVDVDVDMGTRLSLSLYTMMCIRLMGKILRTLSVDLRVGLRILPVLTLSRTLPLIKWCVFNMTFDHLSSPIMSSGIKLNLHRLWSTAK